MKSLHTSIDILHELKHSEEVILDRIEKNVTNVETLTPSEKSTFVKCAVGILVVHFAMGVMMEHITKGTYGEGKDAEKFTYTMALVFVQCIINTIFAKSMMTFAQREVDTTPLPLYAACSLSYLGAMLASNHALQYVSYPTQVLGKSAKPIPVMILGILLAKKRYPAAKFLFILMIVIGVAMFLYKDQKTVETKQSTSTSFIGVGEILLLVSLTLDGLTGASQDRMRSDYKTGAYSMMTWVNAFSIIWLAIGLSVSGEGIAFLGFMERHPSILFKMFSFGVASALGQMFIFITVTTFGPLPCSIITTTRKFFTILGSVIIFQNPMLPRQWIGTVFVFTGLGLDSAYGKEKKNR